jgi:hypothetical protein
MAVPATEVKITGAVKYYDSQADSGRTFSRGFCPECGARLFGKSSGLPDLTMITAGSLDDPNRFRPALDFYVSSAQAWDHMDPALPKFAKLPA